MKKAAKLCIVLFLLTVALSLVFVVSAQSDAISNAKSENVNAYLSILDAYKAGANIDELILQLNQAINLTMQAQFLSNVNSVQAEALAVEAQQLAQEVTNQSNNAHQSAAGTFPVVEVSLAAAFLVIGVAVFFFGPTAFNKVINRNRENRGVTPSKEESKFNWITAKRISAIIMGVMILCALISVAGVLQPIEQGESFSELGILNENMAMENYPSQVMVNQPLHLYGYVGNHMGEPMLYTVMVKLGDNKTVENPTLSSPVYEFSQVVSNNQNWTFPMDITLSKVGVNQRIIFELWAYNQTLHQNQYIGIYGHINVNVVNSEA